MKDIRGIFGRRSIAALKPLRMKENSLGAARRLKRRCFDSKGRIFAMLKITDTIAWLPRRHLH